MVSFLSSFQNANSGEGPDTIFVSVDPDGLGPAGFGLPVAATGTNVGGFAFPLAQPDRAVDAEAEVAYDRSGGFFNGRLYLVYTDRPSTASQSFDIFLRHSDDNGATWSNPVRVTDDTTGFSKFLPRIAVDQTTGDIAISWYDCRNDNGMGAPGDLDGVPNDEPEYFCTFSYDGGDSFEPNIQVATSASSAIFDSNSGNDFGDYTGLAFFGGEAYPTWADNSLTLPNNPDAPNSLDVATARVDAALNPPEDQFEPNETTNTATNFGTLSGSQHLANLTISRHANGLYDYDVYRWTMASAGTFTATETEEISRGGLELHVFKLVGKTLVDEGDVTNRLPLVKTVSVAVKAGDVLFVQVKGRNYAPHRMGTGFYHLDVSLA